MKWKPLIASFVVIAIAITAMAIWSKLGSKPAHNGRGAGNANIADADSGDDGKLEYDITPFEELPARDPLGLWPRDGARMAAADLWVMWQTHSHSRCRLLGTRDRRDWYVLGRTGGEKHFLQANLGFFDSQLTFAVEFEANGERYRSTPRTVVFGKGAHFAQRRYKFTLGDQSQQSWDLEIIGRDATELSQEAFLNLWFPDELSPAAFAKAADTVGFQVQNVDRLNSGCAGFLEVYDARTLTYDRVLIELTR